MMIKHDFSIESKFFRNIMDWDTKNGKLGWIVKPEVQKWMNENINGARFKSTLRSVGIYKSSTHLIFEFKDVEDIMAFKLRWL